MEEYKIVAIDLAKRAGEIMKKNFTLGIDHDILGNEQRYDRPINGFVASNGHVHDELLEMIRTVIYGQRT